MSRSLPVVLATALSLFLSACAGLPFARNTPVAGDPHSYANTGAFRTTHLALDLRVDFAQKRLAGSATLDLARVGTGAPELVLDTRELEIQKVEAGLGETWTRTTFRLEPADPILGSALRIALPAQATRVRVHYRTQPGASGLQWLAPAQTADRKYPFLFTQSQAIHARSWIPLQDTPSVRAPYSARIRTPKNLLAVMSADNDTGTARDGDYRFTMPQAIPSYLIALAVGDLEFRATGPRSGVYAERSVVKAAAKEFEDTEKMIARCEAIFGPYRWGRYDLLILPPSFPYGGMENPRLTFASPTVIAGDKSMVSLVAHELAHSWSGNLVTNAAWQDFWLNEGFTNHLTYRVMEEVYGKDRAQQERALGANDLRETLAQTADRRDRSLMPDLRGRDPDDGVTDVPYEKGALFLAYLEAKFGRARFDAFLRKWFDAHAFQSVRTQDFLAFLDRELLSQAGAPVSAAKVNEWVQGDTMPADTVWPASTAFATVDRARDSWLAGKVGAADLGAKRWSPRQWQYFLDTLPTGIDQEALIDLDETYGLTGSRNAVRASRWYRAALANDYSPVYPAIDTYLRKVGRMLLIRPIYKELARTPDGREFALEIFADARKGYHPIAVDAVEKTLAASPAPAAPAARQGPGYSTFVR
ncbi:MAG TPA: M1 family metallopeptidase [Solimonas sp.]|nr:M1 family metallopeptidase [Solimonas sp.]